MKLKYLTALLFLSMLVVTCKQLGEITPDRMRQMQPSEASGFHPPMVMQIGWFPYQEYTFTKTGDHEWKVVKTDEPKKTGKVPKILIHYPGTKDSIWVDMNIDNELLGKLVKHTLMTQEPIARPYRTFFEEASCAKCHPAEVDMGF